MSKLDTLRPNWKDVPEPTHCLNDVGGARSGDFEPERGGFELIWAASLPKQRVAGSNPVSRSRSLTTFR